MQFIITTVSTDSKVKKNKPLHFVTREESRRKKGRPRDSIKAEAFNKVATYFQENDEEQFTISDLVVIMKQNLPDGSEPYDNKTMKGKLFERFGSNIIVSTLNGRADVITFKTTASNILQLSR